MTRDELIGLLRSWQDYFPMPATWTGELQRRSTGRGPAPFAWRECAPCEGSGKRGRWTCGECKGEGGAHVDAYTDEPVDTEETPWSELLAGVVNCSTCGGWGRLSAYAEARPDPRSAPICDACNGTGRVAAPFSRRLGDDVGRIRHGDRTLDALDDQAQKRDGLKVYRELAVAMDALKAAAAGVHFVVCWVYVIEAQQASPANEATIELGLTFLLERLEHVRAPGWVARQQVMRAAALVRAKGKSADSRAQAVRNDEMRRRRERGAKIAELAAEFQLDKGQVSRIVRGAA